VQWNVKTNRRREIRRGEAKPDVMVLLPKLAEKDAEVERLQNKRNRLVEEKNDLMAKIAQLEWLGGK
jgi:predicted transcriptional regulator